MVLNSILQKGKLKSKKVVTQTPAAAAASEDMLRRMSQPKQEIPLFACWSFIGSLSSTKLKAWDRNL